MDDFSIPKKCVKISELPLKDSRIRQIFILADGKRSIREILRMCPVAEPDCRTLLHTLIEGGYLSFTEIPKAPKEPKPNETQIDSELFMDALTTELAHYVGPFAAIAINSLKLPSNSISKRERYDAIQAVSKEISEKSDRVAFLEAVRQSGLLE